MEIRPIRAGEAEEFLRLLCDVFRLDYSRAHRVFFTEPMFDLNRKWALFEEGDIVSILTTVSLEFGWGQAIGIAGVATRIDRQGNGFAGCLLKEVLAAAQSSGEGAALLFASKPELYARMGFEVIDQVVRGPVRCDPENEPFELVDVSDVQERYNRWSLQDPNRLRRDEKRWGYWRWNLRVCTAFGDGYLCTEGGTLRECVVDDPPSEWPLPAGTEWFGLSSMARQIGVPLLSGERELDLMGRGVPGLPQMFMTDQF